MHAGRFYKVGEVAHYTFNYSLYLLLYASIPTTLYAIFGWTWLGLPWLPIALIGTAVAFMVGFKNNATYSRLWEARQIWGGIVNISRNFGISAINYIEGDDNQDVQRRIIYRHIAWLTALRHQLREPRIWENLQKPYNKAYRKYYSIPEHEIDLDQDLRPHLSEAELNSVMGKSNKAAQIIEHQAQELARLYQQGKLDVFKHIQLQNALNEMIDCQGGCERIKNFPYPRQFATLNYFFVVIFAALVPYGMIVEFAKVGKHYEWLTIPFSALVSWIFFTMERIGEASENPFEGTANDIPMHAMSRAIEIDLKEMLQGEEIPPPHKPVGFILM